MNEGTHPIKEACSSDGRHFDGGIGKQGLREAGKYQGSTSFPSVPFTTPQMPSPCLLHRSKTKFATSRSFPMAKRPLSLNILVSRGYSQETPERKRETTCVGRMLIYDISEAFFLEINNVISSAVVIICGVR
jgi:hypothetical protein